MATTIGSGAKNYNAGINFHNATLLDKTIPSNGSDTLTSMSFWAVSNVENLKCGTFYGAGLTWTNRDYETIGSISAGSKQTFTGLDCNVAINDVIGIIFTSGSMEYASSGGNVIYIENDAFGQGALNYTQGPSTKIAAEGYGESMPVGIKWNGTTITKLNGVAVTKINGI